MGDFYIAHGRWGELDQSWDYVGMAMGFGRGYGHCGSMIYLRTGLGFGRVSEL